MFCVCVTERAVILSYALIIGPGTYLVHVSPAFRLPAGIYVSRNTYLRQGIVEWSVKNAVHLVLYFRYLCFFPDGSFAYRTSPEPLSRVYRSLATPPSHPRQQQRSRAGGKDAEHVQHGRFKQEVGGVWGMCVCVCVCVCDG